MFFFVCLFLGGVVIWASWLGKDYSGSCHCKACWLQRGGNQCQVEIADNDENQSKHFGLGVNSGATLCVSTVMIAALKSSRNALTRQRR